MWPIVAVFLCGLICVVVAFNLDPMVGGWLKEHRVKSWKNVAGKISDYGDWAWLAAAGTVALLGVWRRKRGLVLRGIKRPTLARWQRVLVVMLVASLLAGACANISRAATGRTRPSAKQIPQGFYGVRKDGKWLAGSNKFSSFPSAHTSVAFAFFFPLALRRRRLAAHKGWQWMLALAAIMTASAIGWARVYDGAHHFSDVVTGVWLGISCALWASHFRLRLVWASTQAPRRAAPIPF